MTPPYPDSVGASEYPQKAWALARLIDLRLACRNDMDSVGRSPVRLVELAGLLNERADDFANVLKARQGNGRNAVCPVRGYQAGTPRIRAHHGMSAAGKRHGEQQRAQQG